MYPFKSRWRWLLASRASHIVAAFRLNPVSDTFIMDRIETLNRWGRIRSAVGVLLYVGFLASIASIIGQWVPALSPVTMAFQKVAGIAATFAGVITVVFLYLNRVVGKLEADIFSALLAPRH